MELDLNLASPAAGEDSSSSSSVLMASGGGRDNTSSSVCSAEDGGLARGELVGEDMEEEDAGEYSRENGLITRELFPLASESADAQLQPTEVVRSLLTPSPPVMSNLWEFQVGTGETSYPLEAKALKQQQQQHVKKSRRGPRSRSSQYRGVTFYRRTGRWESHIWLVCLLFSF